MRIGIDARELGGQATGVGRYLRGLLREWAVGEGAPRHEFLLYAAADFGAEVDRRFDIRIVPGRPNTWWEQVRLPAVAGRDRLDLFFAPAYTAPLRLQVPMVVAIHDVSFADHPEWFRKREGLRRRLLTRASARRARAVVTISEFSRRAIVSQLGVPAASVHICPPGVTQPPTSTPGAREERALFVGSIFNRRHVPDLIRAFALVARRRPGASLDLIGDDRTYPPQDIERSIRTEELDGRVRWHRYVSDERLAAFYRHASAFAFLSEYEGLGLPPLEALSVGVPPLLLDTPVARESCGDAAVYVQPGDLDETARCLEQLMTDPRVRARVLDAAPAVLRRYSWPEAAKSTLDLLERAAQ